MNKKLLTILIIFLVVELVWAAFYLSGKQKETPSEDKQKPTVSQDNLVSLSLLPQQKEIKINKPFEVRVEINTKGKSASGADVVVTYDPKILNVSESSITTGNIFPLYPLVKIKPEKGQIAITGVISQEEKPSFQGKGTFATIKFTPIKTGKTTVSFDFTKDSTTDSNIAQTKTAKDILEKVEPATYTIIN